MDDTGGNIEWREVARGITNQNPAEYPADSNIQFTVDQLFHTSNTAEAIPTRVDWHEIPLDQLIHTPEERRQDTMQNPIPTLRSTVLYLEEYFKTEKYPNGISVALDLGNHASCHIDTNCTEAIKMRKFLTEAGIELSEIISGWGEYLKGRDMPKAPYTLRLPDLSGKVLLRIGVGKDVEVDIKDELEAQLRSVFAHKVDEFKYAEETLYSIGRELYDSYLYYIREVRNSKVLSQLLLPISELTKYRCMVTVFKNAYALILPLMYAPQWLFTHGVRYRMNKKHAESLRREIYIMFLITVDNKIMQAKLIYSNGEKFIHYHGVGYDCWGEFRMPEKWDRTITSLANLTYSLQAALTTINRDSLMRDSPPGMPSIMDLFDKAKKMGKENEKGGKEEEIDEEDTTASPPRHWGMEEPGREDQQMHPPDEP